MGFLSAILILGLAAQAFGYAIEPSVSWPGNYRFVAENINLFSGVVKPFEIWYSENYNRSRIDLYGGTIKRVYYGPTIDEDGEEVGSSIFMYHYETDEKENPVNQCDKINYWDDAEDFLPELEYFDYSGEEEYGGKKMTVWTKNKVLENVMKMEETLYVVNVEDEVGVPVQHIKKRYNIQSGALTDHDIVNYYNYESDVKEEDLEADEDFCVEFDPFDIESLHKFHPELPADVEMAFASFKKHHYKEYQDVEHEYRKLIFHENMKKAQEHNSKNLGSKLAINKFADRTKEELRYLTATRFKEPVKGTHKFPYTMSTLNALAKSLPKEFDLRKEGVISPVRNQASCGSCWAFAAAATMEGQLAKTNGGHILDLSEQSLVDCAWKYSSHGCEGTESIGAVYDYLIKHGLPTVEEYGPYLEEDGICRINNVTTTYGIRGYVAVTPLSENALKAAIYRHGPVTIGVLATDKMLLYSSGVFYDTECDSVPPEAMNHAVVVVGYGMRDNDLYWIVKNSWGEDWGEDGYLLISAKNNNCNIMSSPVYPVM